MCVHIAKLAVDQTEVAKPKARADPNATRRTSIETSGVGASWASAVPAAANSTRRVAANTANADIAANPFQVPTNEEEGNTAWDILIGLVARGDAAENRYVLGVYDNRKVIYKQVPSPNAPLYTWASRDPKQRYYQNDTILVAHHDIKATEWIYTTDFLVGQVWPGATYRDPRLIFIENTRYRLGQPIDIQGGTVDRIDQVMAQQGLGGIA